MQFKFLLISLLFHGLILLGLNIPSPQKNSPIIDRNNSLTVEIIHYEKPKKVIVQKRLNEEIPDEADFLSSHNQKVKKQTSSPKILSLKDLQPKIDISQLNPLGSKSPSFEPLGDKVEGVEYGLDTALNSREFVFFSFYTRIRERLESYWRPGVRETLNDLLKKQSYVLSQNRKTKLLITLNNKGQLIKVQVLSPSGVIDLDDEAIKAFKRAEPFPNPPKGLIEKDGYIKITWDFIIER